jgi:TonB-dependent starch-binding outer membrane protein SusC
MLTFCKCRAFHGTLNHTSKAVSSFIKGSIGIDVKQTMLAMRITAAILLIASLHVTAKGVSQTITLSGKNIPLKTVFAEIKKQCGYVVTYNGEIVNDQKSVTVEAKDEPLLKFLDNTLREQQLDYIIQNKTIVVQRHDDESLFEKILKKLTPPIDVKGNVIDQNGQPVEGATVSIKGTNRATSTNQNGEFELNGIDEHAAIIISGVNIETREVKINGQKTLSISTLTKRTNLTEVTVNKGYYTERQKVATGNTYSVKASDIDKQPVSNPLLALVGRVPGVTIEQQSGFANSGVVIRIQGTNSINSGLNPLYVIDGVPFLSQSLPTIGLVQGLLGTSGGDPTAGGGNPLSFINPNDIESIDILKDADATAIYGSRGANGVILISTKKGKPGQTKVNANFRTGWGRVNEKVDLLNTQQYLDMRKEAFANDGFPVPDQTVTPNNSNYDLTYWDQNRYTDWQKVLIGGTARYTDAQISVSGGTANTQFLISTGYHKETTVFPNDFADKKGSFEFNIIHSGDNQKFKIQTSGIYTVYDNQLPVKDLTSYALNLAPNAPALYNADGSLNWAPIPLSTGTVSTWLNPVADYLLNKYSNRINNFIGSSLLSYQLSTNLSISTRFGYTNLQSDEVNVLPLTVVRPEQRSITDRSAQYANGSSTSWIVEPQLTYRLAIGEGTLEALSGTTFQQITNKSQSVTGIGYSSDLLLKNLASAATVTPGTPLYTLYKYNAIFGRLNYNYKDRYVANLTARRDGSSRFGSKNLFNNFWGVAGGWVFTNESWIPKNPDFINFGKFRISYGTTGNDQIGDYGFMNLYNPITVDAPYQGIPTMSPTNLTNPYLQWEETKKLQFGLDLGLVKDRIMVNLSYYDNHSSNLLIPTRLSSITGFGAIMQNFNGKLENRGWEISLTSFNIRKKNISWTTSVNLTIPERNGHLVSFPDFATSVYSNTYAIGRSINDVKRYKFLGVDPSTGLYVFSDNKGNSTNSPVYSQDLISFSNISQRLFGGLQNNIAVKGFELDFTLQFVKKDAKDFTGFTPGNFRGTGNVGNQSTSMLSRWQKNGDQTNVQKVSATSFVPLIGWINYIQSDAGFTDASFLRLTNLSLAWQFPKALVSKVHMQNARLFMQGQNLFTVTKYKGLDPSTGSSNRLPPLQVITLGGQITL